MISDAPEYAACGTSVPLLSACEIETPFSFIGLFLSLPPFFDLSDLVGSAIRSYSYLAPVGLRSLGEALCSDHFTHPWLVFFPRTLWMEQGRRFLVPTPHFGKYTNPCLRPLPSPQPPTESSPTGPSFDIRAGAVERTSHRASPDLGANLSLAPLNDLRPMNDGFLV